MSIVNDMIETALWATNYGDGDYKKGDELRKLCRQFESLELEELLRNDLGV